MGLFSKTVRDVDGRALKKHDYVQHLDDVRTPHRKVKAGDVERVTEVADDGTVCTVSKPQQWAVCAQADRVRKVRDAD